MKIALDWDSTYTADPKLWNTFLYYANQRGWDVYIVTARSPDVPIEYIPDYIKSVVYCSWEAKKNHFDADIWIDDDPGAIVNGYVVNQYGLFSDQKEADTAGT